MTSSKRTQDGIQVPCVIYVYKIILQSRDSYLDTDVMSRLILIATWEPIPHGPEVLIVFTLRVLKLEMIGVQKTLLLQINNAHMLYLVNPSKTTENVAAVQIRAGQSTDEDNYEFRGRDW